MEQFDWNEELGPGDPAWLRRCLVPTSALQPTSGSIKPVQRYRLFGALTITFAFLGIFREVIAH